MMSELFQKNDHLRVALTFSSGMHMHSTKCMHVHAEAMDKTVQQISYASEVLHLHTRWNFLACTCMQHQFCAYSTPGGKGMHMHAVNILATFPAGVGPSGWHACAYLVCHMKIFMVHAHACTL